jgi:hypothetical protein
LQRENKNIVRCGWRPRRIESDREEGIVARLVFLDFGGGDEARNAGKDNLLWCGSATTMLT